MAVLYFCSTWLFLDDGGTGANRDEMEALDACKEAIFALIVENMDGDLDNTVFLSWFGLAKEVVVVDWLFSKASSTRSTRVGATGRFTSEETHHLPLLIALSSLILSLMLSNACCRPLSYCSYCWGDSDFICELTLWKKELLLLLLIERLSWTFRM